jgi:hypothetical protein
VNKKKKKHQSMASLQQRPAGFGTSTSSRGPALSAFSRDMASPAAAHQSEKRRRDKKKKKRDSDSSSSSSSNPSSSSGEDSASPRPRTMKSAAPVTVVKSATDSKARSPVQSEHHKHGEKHHSSSKSGEESSDEYSSEREKKKAKRRRERERRKEREQKGGSEMTSSSSSKVASAAPLPSAASSAAAKSASAGAVASSASTPAPSAAVASSDAGIVKVAIAQPFTAQHKWDQTLVQFNVNKSMEELAAMADVNGEILFTPADGSVTIQRCAPQIAERYRSRLAEPSQRSLLATDPSKVRSRQDAAYRATILHAHNGLPAHSYLRMPNIESSSKIMVFPLNAESEKQQFSFSLPSGATLQDHRVQLADFERKTDFNFFSEFSKFNAENLRDGVMAADPFEFDDESGRPPVARVKVPHVDAEGKMHPVVIKARMEEPKLWSDTEKHEFDGSMPEWQMAVAQDTKGKVLMSQELFDKYHNVVAGLLSAKHPLSDVSNPHFVLTLMNIKQALADKALGALPAAQSAGAVRGGFDADLEKPGFKDMWLDAPEIKTGRTTSAAQKSARETVYQLSATILVESLRPGALNYDDE